MIAITWRHQISQAKLCSMWELNEATLGKHIHPKLSVFNLTVTRNEFQKLAIPK